MERYVGHFTLLLWCMPIRLDPFVPFLQVLFQQAGSTGWDLREADFSLHGDLVLWTSKDQVGQQLLKIRLPALFAFIWWFDILHFITTNLTTAVMCQDSSMNFLPANHIVSHIHHQPQRAKYSHYFEAEKWPPASGSEVRPCWRLRPTPANAEEGIRQCVYGAEILNGIGRLYTIVKRILALLIDGTRWNLLLKLYSESNPMVLSYKSPQPLLQLLQKWRTPVHQK